MTVFTEMREKAEALKARAEDQKKNIVNRREHHSAVTTGLCAILKQIDEAEKLCDEAKKVNEKFDGQVKNCEKKLASNEARRQRAMTLIAQVTTHLEQITFPDSASGQGLALARIALRELQET